MNQCINQCLIVLIFILVIMIGESLQNDKLIENNQGNIEEIIDD